MEEIEKKLDQFIINNRIPHIIFHGTHSVDKKTIINTLFYSENGNEIIAGLLINKVFNEYKIIQREELNILEKVLCITKTNLSQ